MQQNMFDHYRAFSQFTYPGLYQERLCDLPTDIGQLGRLVKQQVIHSIALSMIRDGIQLSPAYGNIREVPWYRQGEEEEKLQEIDALARLMLQPDKNFAQLQTNWETKRDYRLLHGSLV